MIESQITLRDAAPEDMQFLGSLYCDTRRPEVSSWGWPAQQQESFLRMQFDAQYRSYKAAFPDAIDSIVCSEGDPVGRLLVRRETASVHLIDIALVEDQRNRGIGSELIRCLLRECELQGRSLRLQVLQGNPAVRLYQRLGFLQSSSDQMYVQMQWHAGNHREGFECQTG